MERAVQATLVYVRRGGEWLMLHRVKKEGDLHKGKWNGLGGKMEQGESPRACAIREVREESGLTLLSLQFAGHLHFPAFDREGRDWSVFVFTSDSFSGELSECAEGDLHWVAKDKLPELNLWEGDRLFMEHLLAGRPFLGEIRYESGRLSAGRVEPWDALSN